MKFLLLFSFALLVGCGGGTTSSSTTNATSSLVPPSQVNAVSAN